ncbi:hypothetical protein [Nocardia sp. BMG111209]|uniref:hypothetical protein n=1 Tax=Nocardia sp. BMG111209 TaxID=1160137 RepID=UPI00037E6797|nr:hypothetical protein [Nocardia sp. BMG111209]
MNRQQEYRAMLAVDIEGSGGRGNTALLRIREVLFEILRDAVEHSGIDWTLCLRQDLGDGMRVIVPADTSKFRMIQPMVRELSAALEAHNETAATVERIRVRMALHAGDVHLGPSDEPAGRSLVVLARLLDAAPVRKALAQAPEAVVVAVLLSQHFYDETIGHGYPGIDPRTFHRVAVAEKETTMPAWLHLSGAVIVSPPDATATPPATRADEPPQRSTMVNRASGRGVVYATQNGTQHIHTPDES